jgi:hypothetical protein
MNEYIIDSIKFERCKKSPQNILTSLILCDICNNLPLPRYKSFRQQNKTYCKTCYLNHNQKLEDVIYPNRIETNFLEQVIINCSDITCERVFNINTLKDMIEHEKTCGRTNVNDYVIIKCNSCNHVYSKKEAHNCFSELKNYIESNNQNIYLKMKTYFEEQYSLKNQENLEKKNLLCKDKDEVTQKFIKSEDKLQSLERKLFTLGKRKIYERRNTCGNQE